MYARRGKASQVKDLTTLLRDKYGLVPDQCGDPTTVEGVSITGAYDCLQHHQLGGGIPKSTQSLEAVGYDSEGARKDRSNGAGLGSNVQDGGTIGAIIWHKELGDDRGDAQGTDSVTPSGSATDHKDNGETQGRRGVGVPIGREGGGIRGAPPH